VPAPNYELERIAQLEAEAASRGWTIWTPDEPDPDPEPPPPSGTGLPADAMIAVGNGAGNQPPRGGAAFVGQRLFPHPWYAGKGRKVKRLHFKGKEDVNYAGGTPRWRTALHAIRADGRYDLATLLTSQDWDARTLISNGGGGGDCVIDVSAANIPWDPNLLANGGLWFVVTDIDGNTSFASVNFLRGVSVQGQRHVSDQWGIADTRRTLWGLDPRSVVYHDDTYVGSPTWGWYGSPTVGSLYMLPTYVIETDAPEGATDRFDGQPFYGAWGNTRPAMEFESMGTSPLTGVVAMASNGSSQVTVRTAAGSRTVLVPDSNDAPGFYRFSSSLARTNGETIHVTAGTPSAFRSMAMDSNWDSKGFASTQMIGWKADASGYGVMPISPVDWP
jgi:hypothetical protein